MKYYYWFVFVFWGVSGQTVVFEENFEQEPSFLHAEMCSSWQEGLGSSGMDYFTRTDGSNLHASISYNGQEGNYFWAAMDTNSAPCFLDSPFIEFKNISIVGQSNLFLSLMAAEDVAEDGMSDWDSTSSVYVALNIDQQGYEKVFQFAASGPQSSNTPAMWDSDLDGVGDSRPLTASFQEFVVPILKKGDLLDLKIVFKKLNAMDEDIAIDRIRLVQDFDLSVTSLTWHSSLQIVPNPLDDEVFYIQTPKNRSCQLTVYNVIGQRLFSEKELTNTPIRLKHLRKGLYFFVLNFNGYKVCKIVSVAPRF